MTVAKYCRGHDGSNTVSETDLNLSEIAKFMSSLMRIEITGNTGPVVPVLLKSFLKQAVDLLIETRPLLNISDTYKHVFCTVSERSAGYIRD